MKPNIWKKVQEARRAVGSLPRTKHAAERTDSGEVVRWSYADGEEIHDATNEVLACQDLMLIAGPDYVCASDAGKLMVTTTYTLLDLDSGESEMWSSTCVVDTRLGATAAAVAGALAQLDRATRVRLLDLKMVQMSEADRALQTIHEEPRPVERPAPRRRLIAGPTPPRLDDEPPPWMDPEPEPRDVPVWRQAAVEAALKAAREFDTFPPLSSIQERHGFKPTSALTAEQWKVVHDSIVEELAKMRRGRDLTR